jgi:hypothetical protein
MNSIASYLSPTQAATYFKDHLLPDLSSKQMKITAVVLVIFSLGAIASYALYRSLQQRNINQRQQVADPVPQAAQEPLLDLHRLFEERNGANQIEEETIPEFTDTFDREDKTKNLGLTLVATCNTCKSEIFFNYGFGNFNIIRVISKLEDYLANKEAKFCCKKVRQFEKLIFNECDVVTSYQSRNESKTAYNHPISTTYAETRLTEGYIYYDVNVFPSSLI